MIPYSKHVGLWLLLAGGLCGVASNIAALFGYTGRYNLELVIGCIISSLVVGAFSNRLAKRKLTASQIELIRARAYRGLSKAQRFRWFFAWTGSGVVFGILDFVAYQTTHHLFPNLTSQIVMAVALAISGSLAALFGVFMYQRELNEIFSDRQ